MTDYTGLFMVTPAGYSVLVLGGQEADRGSYLYAVLVVPPLVAKYKPYVAYWQQTYIYALLSKRGSWAVSR